MFSTELVKRQTVLFKERNDYNSSALSHMAYNFYITAHRVSKCVYICILRRLIIVTQKQSYSVKKIEEGGRP